MKYPAPNVLRFANATAQGGTGQRRHDRAPEVGRSSEHGHIRGDKLDHGGGVHGERRSRCIQATSEKKRNKDFAPWFSQRLVALYGRGRYFRGMHTTITAITAPAATATTTTTATTATTTATYANTTTTTTIVALLILVLLLSPSPPRIPLGLRLLLLSLILSPTLLMLRLQLL